MATAYEPRTDLADRLLTRTERGPRVGFGSALFRRLGIADPFAGGDVQDRALTQPRFDFLSSRAYLAELRGLSRRRLMLIDRISGIRSALRSHRQFQQRVATPAVRAATLGLESGTLIDWSSQIEDDVEAEEEIPGDAGLSARRRAEERGLRDTAATRALKSEIAQASGVLAQLQRLLDSGRDTTDRSMTQRIAAMERQAPAEREGSVRTLARELRGVAAVARRGTELASRSSSVGERPLAVAQGRQAENGEAKGLRRVLGESPVIMTLEEPEAVEASEDLAPLPRRSARPSVEPRVARDAHAGRVARVATEARSQASVGRAGPPSAPASAQPAQRVAEAPQRNVRVTTRPTQRIARAAMAASNFPLNDTRRGLKAIEAPRVATRAVHRSAEPTLSREEARGVRPSDAPIVRHPASGPTQAPEMVGLDSEVEATDSETEGVPARSTARAATSAPATSALATSPPEAPRTPTVEGIARIAARSAAGSMDSEGRVTGATRYLAAEPTKAIPERRVVVEHADGRFRAFDVASTDPRPMAIAQAAPSMAMPEPEQTSEAVEAEEHAAPNHPHPVTARPRPASVSTTPARVEASKLSGTPMRSVARAMLRSVPTATARAIAVSRPAVHPSRVERTRTDAVAPTVSTQRDRVRTSRRVAPVSAAPPSPRETSATPTRGSLQTTVSSSEALRAAASPTTGIRRRSRALPTVRAAARTLSRERWGARGRMLSPSVSRFVDAESFDEVVAPGLPQAALRGGDVTRTLDVPSAVADPVLATLASTDVEAEDGEETGRPRAATPTRRGPARAATREVATAGRAEGPAGPATLTAPSRPVGPAARAAERASELERVASGRTLAAPRVIAPFHDEAPASSRPAPFAATSEGTPDSTTSDRTGVGASVAERLAPSVVAPAAVDAVRRESQGLQAPELVTAAPSSVGPDASDTPVAAGSVARAVRRGSEVVPAARRTLLPQVTPEQQLTEAHRVVARTERRLRDAGEPSPFRAPSTQTGTITAPLDPVLVRSVADENPSEGVADAVVRANARAERPAVTRGERSVAGIEGYIPVLASLVASADSGDAAGGLSATSGVRSVADAVARAERPVAARGERSAAGILPGIEGYTPILASRGASADSGDAAEGLRTMSGARRSTTSVESPVARAGRRSESTRTSLASSPVTSARSFTDEVAAVQPRRTWALAPETVFAEHPIADVPTQEPRPSSGRAPSARAHTGTRRPVATARRAPATVRALGRSRRRRDLRSVVPHPVGTPRTERASARMLDRAPGAVAAPEAVLVRPDEVVDLADAPTAPGERNLSIASTLAGRAPELAAEGAAPFDRLADRAEVAPVAEGRRAPTALVDGMTLAESWSEPALADESVAGGRRAVGRLPGQDRSRLAPRTPTSSVVRSALQDVLQNATVLRAAERGDDPVVSVPGVRRAVGLPQDRSTRFEARVRPSGRGMETIVVDTLTGEQIRTAGPTVLPQLAAEQAPDVPCSTPVERAERRDAAVETTQGRPRASVRDAVVPPALLALPQADPQVPGRTPLSQTFSELLEGRSPADDGAQPLLRRRTWNRRQLAHELGAFAPAMAEAEFLEAPTASEEAPGWARRAVTGTGVQQHQTRGPAARADRQAPPGVSVEDGVARAFEPSSLLGALSRADGPEELIKVIVERRTEVRTVRETLPVEAVRIVERLATLSPDEAAVLQGSRTLQAQPRTNLAGPSRGRRGKGFTQLSGANDGHGANQVMKLADKLRNLIHLAENQRLADAHRELQMSQAAAKASSAAFDDPRGPGQSPDAQTMNMQKLQDDVWKSLQKQFEKLKTQMGDL